MSMQLTSRRLVSGGDGRGVEGGDGGNGRSCEDSGRAGGGPGDPSSAVDVFVGSDGCVEDVERDAGRDGAERCVLVKMGYICAGGLGCVMGGSFVDIVAECGGKSTLS